MKTNYIFRKGSEYNSLLFHLLNAIKEGSINNIPLTREDILLASAIVDDLKEIGCTEPICFEGCVISNIKVKYKKFPETVIGNFVDPYIKCSSDETPFKEQSSYKQLQSPITNNNPSSSDNMGKKNEQVCQFGDGLNYTILPDGSIMEAQVDEEIKEWFNLYNFHRENDPNTFDNTIVKLRSILPKLKKKFTASNGNHSIFQFVAFNSPTDFILAEIGSGRQVVINGQQVVVQV